MPKEKASLLNDRRMKNNTLDNDFQKLFGLYPDSNQKRKEIILLPLDKLIPFKNHPFSLYCKEKLEEMAESIKSRGVDTPIIVRKSENGEYEIIAGHNRVESSRIAGCETIPGIVVEVDDDTAVLMMTDSNLLQRDRILPSERGRAYKMQMDVLNRQGQRRDLTLSQNDTKLDSLQLLADRHKMSRAQIARYIRLTELITELSALVDNNKLNFGIAVDLSYLTAEHQKIVLMLSSTKKYMLKPENGKKLKKCARENSLTKEKIHQILALVMRPKTTVKIPYKKLSRFNIPENKMQEIIIQALEMYFESVNK